MHDDAHRDAPPPQTAESAERPLHLRLSFILLVFCGGALGTAARQGLILLFPSASDVPWIIFAINIIGAFLLGMLLESLLRRGSDTGRRRITRLLFGTGFLGGFTTYSALAVDTVHLADHGTVAILYSVGSVILGLLAAFTGILLGAALHRDPRS